MPPRLVAPLAALTLSLAQLVSPSVSGAQIARDLAPPDPSRPDSSDRAPDGDGFEDPTDPQEEVLTAEIPEPPGGIDEVRYPVPTPEVTGAQPDEPSIRIPSRITTRLRALDANLRSLGARGGGNIVNAVLSMLTGGLSITLGAFAAEPMNIYLYVYGGVAAARGILDLVLTPNASGASITYQHMPMTDRAEVDERLRFGENALSSLADQALIARIVDASLNMSAGVAIVPIYLAPNDFEISDPLDYFVLIGAGVSVVSGIITLASTSAEEQRWHAYERLRDRLEEERQQEGGEDLAVVPTSPGVSVRPSFAGLHIVF